jgi:type II secretion system protein I
MMSRLTTTRTQAFTFIEVLVALAIASIALLGLLRVHLISMATADAAQAMTQAVFLAQEKLAEASLSGDPRQGVSSGIVETNGLRFTWKTEIINVGAHATGSVPLNGLREVCSTVTWQRGASQKSVQMSTYVADSKTNGQRPQ